MKKSTMPLYIGVILSLIAIWVVNDFLLVEPCLENGGSFNYSKAECLLKSGEVKVSELGKYLMAVYFFMGLLITFIVSLFIRKTFKIE
jgi:hypothetical protein